MHFVSSLLLACAVTAIPAAETASLLLDIRSGSAGSEAGGFARVGDGRVFFTATADGTSRGWYAISADASTVTAITMPNGWTAPAASPFQRVIDAGSTIWLPAFHPDFGWELLVLNAGVAMPTSELRTGTDDGVTGVGALVVGEGSGGSAIVLAPNPDSGHTDAMLIEDGSPHSAITTDGSVLDVLCVRGSSVYLNTAKPSASSGTEIVRVDLPDGTVTPVTLPSDEWLVTGRPEGAQPADGFFILASTADARGPSFATEGLLYISGATGTVVHETPIGGVLNTAADAAATPDAHTIVEEVDGTDFAAGSVVTARVFDFTDRSLRSSHAYTKAVAGLFTCALRLADGRIVVAEQTTSGFPASTRAYSGTGATLADCGEINAEPRFDTLFSVSGVCLMGFPSGSTTDIYRIDADSFTLVAQRTGTVSRIGAASPFLGGSARVWNLESSGAWSFDGSTATVWSGVAPSSFAEAVVAGDPADGDRLVYFGSDGATGDEPFLLGAPASDTTPPTATVAAPSGPTNAASLDFTVTFSEAVTGLAAEDLTIGNGTLSTIAGSGPYTVTVTPTTTLGTVSVALASGSVVDGASNALTATGSTLSASVAVDRVAPSATVTAPTGPTNSASLEFTVAFSEAVTDFDSDDLQAYRGSISSITGSGSGPYTVTITPSEQGEVGLLLAVSSVHDAAGNDGTDASSSLFDDCLFDNVAPTLVLTPPPSGPAAGTRTFLASFSEAVTGVTADDFTASSGIVSVSGSGGSYEVVITGASPGPLTVSTTAGRCVDAAGNLLTGTGSTLSAETDVIYPVALTITFSAGSIENRVITIQGTIPEGISLPVSFQVFDRLTSASRQVTLTYQNGSPPFQEGLLSQENKGLSLAEVWTLEPSPDFTAAWPKDQAFYWESVASVKTESVEKTVGCCTYMDTKDVVVTNPKLRVSPVAPTATADPVLFQEPEPVPPAAVAARRPLLGPWSMLAGMIGLGWISLGAACLFRRHR
ncbi:MAG: hypothetical protein J0M02_13390 [Planctomycetes bacterium]|nr:hypothetical protein [Planctomycetota bacterium]